MVTRAQVDGVDSYIAVVPDKDCIVNKGDHSPARRLRTRSPSTQPKRAPADRSNRASPPPAGARYQGRSSSSGDVGRGARPGRPPRSRLTLDKGGPSSIGVWAADHLSPEMNFTSTKLFFAPPAKRASTTRSSGPAKASRCGRSTTGRSGTPSTRRSPTISARRTRCSIRIATSSWPIPSLYTGTNSVRDGHRLLQPRLRAEEQEGRDRPAHDGLGAERPSPRWRAPAAEAEHRCRARQLADERHPEPRTCTTRPTSTPASTRPASLLSRPLVTQPKYAPESTEAVTGVPAGQGAPGRGAARQAEQDTRSCSRRA